MGHDIYCGNMEFSFFWRNPVQVWLGFLFLVSVNTPALAAQSLFKIQGTNSLYGGYQGQVQVLEDGTATRIARYTDYHYQGLVIDSVWSGVFNPEGIHFSLTSSHVLTSFNGYDATDADLKTPEAIEVPLTSVLLGEPSFSLSFKSEREGRFTETWVSVSSANDSEPIWKDLRQIIPSVGTVSNVVFEFANWFAMDRVYDWYRSQPQTQAYQNRPEFKEAQQYIFFDPTDFDFYQQTQGVLRIDNQYINPLSLGEALQRKHAYGPTLGEKEKILTNDLLKYNFNSAGLLQQAHLNASGTLDYSRLDYDSDLWTGVFAFSQALKYKVTGDESAYQNFTKALNGLLTSVEIAHGAQDFARTLVASGPHDVLPPDWGPGWVQGEGSYSAYKWRKQGNNDMFKGLALAYSVAASTLKREDRVLWMSRIAAAVKELQTKPGLQKSWYNVGILAGLSALTETDPDAQSQDMDVFARNLMNGVDEIANATALSDGFYFGGIADWSGLQLNVFSSLVQSILSDELEKDLPRSLKSIAHDAQKDADVKFYQLWKGFRPARRGFIALMANAYSETARRDPEFQKDLHETAIWTLREMTAPRTAGPAMIDLSRRPEWSMSAWPVDPWEALASPWSIKSNLKFQDFEQGAYGYPLFESSMWESDFAWSDNPYASTHDNRAGLQRFSSDYLLIYWVSRFSGLIP